MSQGNYADPDRAPMLSIITVTLNNAGGLEKTLAGIARQTFKSFELIVIDGGSSDNTLTLIGQCPDLVTRWVSEPDNGIYDAMNKGISLARGRYLNFLNAGDTYTDPTTLETVFGPANAVQSDLIYGDIILMDGPSGAGRLQKARTFRKAELLRYGTGVLCHQAVFLRRALAPLYDTRWRFKAELNWYFDILDSSPSLSIRHIDVPLVNYSLGGFGQVNFWANQAEWFRLVRHRFGWFAVIRYGLPLRLMFKLPYRYKWLRRMSVFTG